MEGIEILKKFVVEKIMRTYKSDSQWWKDP